MSLKSLIQRLLDSRTTPSEAAHNAMPSATKTTFLSKDETVGSWGTLNAGVAPSDGYLFVNASAEDNTNSEVRAQLGNIFHVSAQAPRISLPTPHRATAGRLLGAIQLQSQLLKSKSRTGRWHLLPYLTETLRELESVVTLKKGHRLSSCAVAEVQPIILFGSTKQVQTFNPLTGGALC